MSNESQMNDGGESNSGIVPTKQPNEGTGGPKEAVEERPLTKENMDEPDSYRAQNREREIHRPDHVREAAPNRVCFHAAIRGRNRVRQVAPARVCAGGAG